MDKLKEKVRALTALERRKLAKEGLYLSSMKTEMLEQAIYKVLDLVFSEKDLDGLNMEEEVELYNAIFDKTYNINKEDAGN